MSRLKVWRWPIAWVLVMVQVGGCNSSSTKKMPQTPASETSQSNESSAVVASEKVETNLSEMVEVVEVAEVTEPQAIDLGSEFEATTLADKQSKGEWSWYRYGLLLDDGPLLIDFVASVGREGLLQSRQRRHAEIAAMLAEMSESDESREASKLENPMPWSDVLSHPMVRGRVFANLQADGEMQGTSLIRQYDRDGDGQAQSTELHAFLTRGLSERPAFVLDEASEFRGMNRDESPLFVRLDTDSDAVLSSSEISQIMERISVLDRNGDRVISLDEVRAPTMDGQAYMRRRRSDAMDLAFPILGDSKGRMEAELLARYEVGDGIDRQAWSDSAELFAQLDENQDLRLEKSELSGIADAPSSLLIRLDWESLVNESGNGLAGMTASVPLGGMSRYQVFDQERGAQEGEFPTELLWEKPKIRLRVRFRDPLGVGEIERRVSQIAESMGVAKDRPQAIVEGLSFGPAGVTAAGMDRNRDEKLSWDEVMWSVRAKAILTSELVRVRLVEIPDSWFTWLDQDWDDVLSESEIANSPARLAQLLSDSDSDLAPESLPVQLDVLVTRIFGDEDPFGSDVFASAPAPSPESKPLPEWFQAMDTNGDGLVTRREFLGGDESLKSLDRDRNGWLDIQDLR